MVASQRGSGTGVGGVVKSFDKKKTLDPLGHGLTVLLWQLTSGLCAAEGGSLHHVMSLC